MKTASFILTFLFASLCHADDLSHAVEMGDTSIYDTSLEDLLQIQITTGSKQVETIEKAPAIISIVTEKEIEAYGALSVADVLDRVTSSYPVGTLPLPRGMLSMRGDVTSEQNNHILILLNGRPLRDSIYSGLNEEIYTAFPVAAIKQIEVIRGPGSVLYGTNAFVGVINIITKDASDQILEPTLRYGSLNTKQISTFAAKRFQHLELSGAISYLHNDGWDFTATDRNATTNTSVTQTQKQFDRNLGANLLARYQKLTFNGYFASEELPFMSSASNNPQWSLAGTHKGTRIALDLGYDDSISENWKHSLNLTYNHLAILNKTAGISNDASSNDLLLENVHYFNFSPTLSGLLGGVYSKQTGKGTIKETAQNSIPSYSDDVFSLYSQLTLELFKSLRLTLGAQGIKVPANLVNVVPRIGATYSLSPNTGAKILYSWAYRAPSEAERHLTLFTPNSSIDVGNPNLIPETTKTLDLQLYYQNSKQQLSLTYFHSRQLNLINPVFVSGSPKYQNAANERAQGVEIEGKWNTRPNLTLQGAVTYQSSQNDQGGIDDGHIPNWMAKTGISYHLVPWGSLGLFNSFYSRPKQVDNGVGSTAVINPEVTYSNYLTGNLTLDVNKILRLGQSPPMEFQLLALNILNAEIFYPEYVYGVINSFPGRAGRTFYGAMKITL